MKKLLPLILILFAAPCFAESYLCIADGAAGFDAHQIWKPKTFRTDSKYLIKPIDEEILSDWPIVAKNAKDDKYWIAEFGNDFPIAFCPHSNSNWYECRGLGQTLWFDSKALKFTALHPGGWMNENLKTDDTGLEIATCSKL